MILLLSWAAWAAPTVCLQNGKAINFVFESSADFPNRIQLVEEGTGLLLQTFHNKYEDLENKVYGVGKHRYIPDRDLCLQVHSHHQLGGTWRVNRSKHTCTRAQFEDSDDADFNDAMLRIEGYQFYQCPKQEDKKLQTKLQRSLFTTIEGLST